MEVCKQAMQQVIRISDEELNGFRSTAYVKNQRQEAVSRPQINPMEKGMGGMTRHQRG